MLSVKVLSQIMSTTAVVLVLTLAVLNHLNLAAHGRWLLVTSALIGTASLVWQVIAYQGSIYGQWDRSALAAGTGLVWALVFWPGRDKKLVYVVSILAVLLLIANWLPGDNNLAQTFQGGWFGLAQAATAMGVSLWLYAAMMVLVSDVVMVGSISNWALLLQVIGMLALLIGAQRIRGQILSWDPVECWWLFAVAMGALALWGKRHRNWGNLVIVLTGVVPALITWFGSWLVIRTLQLASYYFTGS